MINPAKAFIEALDVQDKRKALLKIVKQIIVNKERTHAKIRGYISLFLNVDKNQNYESRSIGWNRRIAQCR